MALLPRAAAAQRVDDLAKLPDPTADLYPAKRNEKYVLDRPITDEKINDNYNNFYEFNSSKEVSEQAQLLPIRPWTVKIDGLVEKPFEIGIDELIRKMTLEERTYRHRCVEGWSMAIAWTGFPLARLVDFAKPLGSAKFVRMETFTNPKIAPGERMTWFPWPYVEGLTMAEATNDLAFMATGAYGHAMASSTARRCGWRCRGNTASSRSSRSCVSASSSSGRRVIGRRCSRPNTASGPTSIRRCRIRAGARRARK